MDKKRKGFLKEFKEFVSRGSVIDLAVGVIMGSAFTAIVNSLVKEIIMPVFSIIVGGYDLESLKIVLKPAAGELGEVAIKYGLFIQQIFSFLLIALVIFIMLKLINRLRKPKEEPKEPPVPEDILLLREIRDSLKSGK